MRKIIVIFLVLATMLASSQAYSQGAPKPIFGAKGGFNFANIGGDETDNKMKTAFHAGVYSEVFFDYFLMMQAELLLSYQGHAPIDDQPFSSSLNLWYINLPIMARYNIGYNLNVHAGFQFGVLLSAKSNFNEDGVDPVDQSEFFKAVDFGLPLGVGYDLMDRKISVTARYVIPINNISTIDGVGQRRTNSVFQVSLGIMLMTVDE